MGLQNGVIENFAVALNSNGSKGVYNGIDTAINYAGGAANFNGAPSNIAAGSFSELAGAVEFSLSLKFNVPFFDNYYLVSKWTYPTQNTFALRLLSTGAGFLYIGSSPSDTGNNGFGIPFNYTLNVENHVLVTFKGSEILQNDRAVIYYNGNILPTTISGAIPTSLSAGTSPLTLGMVLPSYDNLRGSLKDVCIWNRSLTSLEASELWNSGNVLKYPFALAAANNSNFFKMFLR